MCRFSGGSSTTREGRPPHHQHQPQRPAASSNSSSSSSGAASIDLGALVESTIMNSVTREFSQHWIIVGKDLRVLLLDFDGAFTLLIPNVENGQAFR